MSTLTNAIRGMITLARVVRSTAAAAKHVFLDTQAHRPDRVPYWQPYGFQAAPLEGSVAVHVATGGHSDELFTILVHDRRYTVALAGGDVVLIDYRGNRVLLGAEGVQLTNDGTALLPVDGVLTGRAIDPFTGSTHFVLGNASTVVKAKK